MKKITIFQAIDQKLEAQLRLQQYQVDLAEENKLNKQFQDQIKNLAFEVKTKATQLISKYEAPATKSAIALFAINVFEKLPLTARSFNEISDKEYFQNTLNELESSARLANPQDLILIKNAIESYNKIDMINNLQVEYDVFDNGKSKVNKYLYIVVYPLICVVTVVGIPLLYFTKKVVGWAEGTPYKTFRTIATVDLAVKNNPLSFVKNFYNQPFTGKYPELKSIRNLSSFKNYCNEELEKANFEINNISVRLPEIKLIAGEFI